MKLEQGAGSGEQMASCHHSGSKHETRRPSGLRPLRAPRSQLPAPCSPLTAFLEEVP
jgi:hypothetical protein